MGLGETGAYWKLLHTKVLIKITSDLNNGKDSVIVFMVFSKAFDNNCVNHNNILSKLEERGVRGLPFK